VIQQRIICYLFFDKKSAAKAKLRKKKVAMIKSLVEDGTN
jgi:hypothetical protein